MSLPGSILMLGLMCYCLSGYRNRQRDRADDRRFSREWEDGGGSDAGGGGGGGGGGGARRRDVEMTRPHVNRIKEIDEMLYVRPATAATHSDTGGHASTSGGGGGASTRVDVESATVVGEEVGASLPAVVVEGSISLDDDEGDMCAVCLSELSDQVKILPCNHTFHASW